MGLPALDVLADSLFEPVCTSQHKSASNALTIFKQTCIDHSNLDLLSFMATVKCIP